MKSSVVERSRVSVEDAFWKGLQEIIVKRRDEPRQSRRQASIDLTIDNWLRLNCLRLHLLNSRVLQRINVLSVSANRLLSSRAPC